MQHRKLPAVKRTLTLTKKMGQKKQGDLHSTFRSSRLPESGKRNDAFFVCKCAIRYPQKFFFGKQMAPLTLASLSFFSLGFFPNKPLLSRPEETKVFSTLFSPVKVFWSCRQKVLFLCVCFSLYLVGSFCALLFCDKEFRAAARTD